MLREGGGSARTSTRAPQTAQAETVHQIGAAPVREEPGRMDQTGFSFITSLASGLPPKMPITSSAP